MKVILLKDVAKIGKRHEIKDVSDGYGRNFLIRKGEAVYATPKEIKRIEKLNEEKTQKKISLDKKLEETVRELSKKEIPYPVRANEKGILFSGISKKDVSDFLKNKLKITLPEEHLSFEEPIKKTGAYPIEIVGGEGKNDFTLIVEAGE